MEVLQAQFVHGTRAYSAHKCFPVNCLKKMRLAASYRPEKTDEGVR